MSNYVSYTISEFSQAVPPGGVVIQSSVESRPMQIGGANNAAVAGINLTSAELARIITTSTGTVTIGDSNQTGNITFTTATPATTPGASVNVIQSTAGAGQIILDDASGTGIGLNGNGGAVTLTPGTGGIAAELFATGTPLVSNGFSATGSISLTLGVTPTLGQKFTVISNTATPANSHPINGAFSNLRRGARSKSVKARTITCEEITREATATTWW